MLKRKINLSIILLLIIKIYHIDSKNFYGKNGRLKLDSI